MCIYSKLVSSLQEPYWVVITSVMNTFTTRQWTTSFPWLSISSHPCVYSQRVAEKLPPMFRMKTCILKHIERPRIRLICSASSYLLSARFAAVIILGMEEGAVVPVTCNCWSSNKLCACQVTSVVSDSVQPCGWLKPTRLLCPWDSPGKNTGVGFCALLQGIFLTQGSNLCLLCLPALAGGFFTLSATREALW